MTKIKNTMRELYEQVRAYDDLLDIPQSVKYSKHHHTRQGIENLIKEVEEFNGLPVSKDSIKDCKRLFNNAMRIIAELLEKQTELNYNHKLELKKARYLIDRLKQYIDDKEDLDKELPSDDEEESSDKEKDLLKGLLPKERQLMKGIK